MTHNTWTPCRSNPDNWTDPQDPTTAKQAATICTNECTLIDACRRLWETLTIEERKHGVWYGTTPTDRNRRAAKPCQTCGETKPIYGRGQCRRCWNRDYERKHRRNRKRPDKRKAAA